MDSTALRDLFRTEVMDLEEPTLWSDAEIFAWLDDAQFMFCRETGGLADAVSPLTQLAITPGTQDIALSDKILKVRDAYRVDTGRPVTVLNYEDMPTLGLRFDGRVGPLQALILGMSASSVRVYPAPNETVQVQLLVDRLPLTTIDDEDQALEIAPQHHQHLLLWVKHRAYSKQDAETRDDRKAADYEQKFTAYCEKARKERERAMHKTRTVAYGGIGPSIGDYHHLGRCRY